MAIAEILGLKGDKRVRYGIVGLGSISQEAMMPGVEHTGNSEITALVTGDSTKAATLGEEYGIVRSYSYESFQEMLSSGFVDAIYLATPNWRHAEFAIPALEAGIHVLLEKPMEISSEQCEAILSAQKRSGAKLMIAYRLHFEPATVAAIEKVRSGELGHVHLFSSLFSQMVKPTNHRVQHGELAGPLFDMGPYPINGVRNLFGEEPIEAFGTTSRHADSGFADLDDTVSVILRFPQERLAQFTVSYYGDKQNTYTVVGTKGALEVNPGFMYGMPLEHTFSSGGEKKHESFKNTDHFGGEMRYFSQCILENSNPEPDGYEGLADVRVIEAILRSQKSGRFERVVPVTRTKMIDPEHTQTLRAVNTPEMVNASAPARGVDKSPKN